MQDLVDLTLTAAAGALLVWAIIGIVNRRWKRVALSSLAALGMLLWVVRHDFSIAEPWDVIDATRMSRLKPGMTLAEVESVLGMPPGRYGNPACKYGYETMENFVPDGGKQELVWCDDFKKYEVWFDDHGRFVGWYQRAGYSATYYDMTMGDGGFRARIRMKIKDRLGF